LKYASTSVGSFVALFVNSSGAWKPRCESGADATAACLDAGGSPAHHGVGLLKAPFLAEELGATGVDILRRVKAAFDPQWLLNPGKLVPRPEGL